MKKPFIPAILLVILVSCTKPEPPPPPAPVVDTVGENNKAVVTQYTDAIVKGDTSAIGNFLSDTYRGFGPGLNDSTDRAKEIKEWGSNWKNDFASIDFNRATIQAFTIPEGDKYPGDWVSDWALITVTYKNGFKPFSFWFNGVYSVKDGKIQASRSFWNQNDYFTQQGFTVTPPKPAKK